MTWSTAEVAPMCTNRHDRYRNPVGRPKVTDRALLQRILLQNNHKALTSQCLSPTSFTVIWGTSANLFHLIDILPPGAGGLLPTRISPWWRPGGDGSQRAVEQKGEGGTIAANFLEDDFSYFATAFIVPYRAQKNTEKQIQAGKDGFNNFRSHKSILDHTF